MLFVTIKCCVLLTSAKGSIVVNKHRLQAINDPRQNFLWGEFFSFSKDDNNKAENISSTNCIICNINTSSNISSKFINSSTNINNTSEHIKEDQNFEGGGRQWLKIGLPCLASFLEWKQIEQHLSNFILFCNVYDFLQTLFRICF